MMNADDTVGASPQTTIQSINPNTKHRLTAAGLQLHLHYLCICKPDHNHYHAYLQQKGSIVAPNNIGLSSSELCSGQPPKDYLITTLDIMTPVLTLALLKCWPDHHAFHRQQLYLLHLLISAGPQLHGYLPIPPQARNLPPTPPGWV